MIGQVVVLVKIIVLNMKKNSKLINKTLNNFKIY